MNLPYNNVEIKANNMRELLSVMSAKYNNDTAFSYREKMSDQNAVQISYRKLAYDAKCFGTEAIARGMAGKHCALIGKLSYQWMACYLSLMSIGAVPVPLDRDWTEESLADTVKNADCAFLFCDGDIADKAKVITENTEVGEPIFITGQFESFTNMLTRGADLVANGDNSYSKAPIDPEGLGVLVYTSGTTGQGKGVMLSQKAIISDVIGGLSIAKVGKKTIALLPPHHTLGSNIAVLAPMLLGVNIYISKGVKYLVNELKAEKPDFLILVPLYLETFHKKIKAGIAAKGMEKTFDKLMFVSNKLRKIGINATKKLFSSVLSTFGGNLEVIICGGAPLSNEVFNFFSSLGLTIMNGYGITECAPLISVNRNEDITPGSVGTVIRGGRIKIESLNDGEEGEICYYGPNIMLGYYKNEAATEDCMDGDGYFHTGDIGKLDDEGHLYITGRMKNLIILSNGKNVYPEEIESEICDIPGVQEAIVYEGISARGIEFNSIVAEFYMDSEYIEENGIQDIKKYLQPYIDKYNRTAVPYKKITIVRVRNEEFPKNTLRKIIRFKIDRTID